MPDDTGRAMLSALHARGVRGVRFASALKEAKASSTPCGSPIASCRSAGMSRLNVGLPGAGRALAKAEWRLMQFPLAVCFSGLGVFRQGRRADDADLQFLLGMVQLGRFWLKLSGDDLTPPQLKLWDEPSPLARALQNVRKDRLIWGSGKQHGGDSAAHVASGLATLEKCRAASGRPRADAGRQSGAALRI